MSHVKSLNGCILVKLKVNEMSIFEFEFKKRSSSYSVTEDELTSRVFGLLESVNHKFLSEWINIDGINSIEYWPKFKFEDEGIEPDIVITDRKDKKILVECKFTDLGTVRQIKKEYKLAKNVLNGDFIFITANLSRPEVLSNTEKELKVIKGTLNWTNWINLYNLIIKSDEYNNKSNSDNYVLTQLVDFLEWLKMGYNLGELFKKYKEIYDEKWLDILYEYFHEFELEIRRKFKNTEKEKDKITATGDIGGSLFDYSWINLSSENVMKVDENLYYFIMFRMKEYEWRIYLGGKNKVIREKVRKYLNNIKLKEITYIDDFEFDRITYLKIISNPDFNKLDELKDTIVEKSLEFINDMNNILLKGKKNNDL